MIDAKLTQLKGIGTKRLELFARLGLETVRDLLAFLPRDYKDFSKITPVALLTAGDACSRVRVVAEPRYSLTKRNCMISVKSADETGSLELVWFYPKSYYFGKNRQHANVKKFAVGNVMLVLGKVDVTPYGKRMVNPETELPDENGQDSSALPGIQPLYPLTAGLTQKMLRSVVRQALSLPIHETLPERLKSAYALCGLREAFANVHFPPDFAALESARRRLALEELFSFFLLMARSGKERKAKQGIRFLTEGMAKAFCSLLPFAPTDAQREAMGDIGRDMAQNAPMNRLVQGDVGSGKTVLAFFALFVAAENGYQGAILAPTEILARQHYETALALFGGRYGIELLTGSMTGKQKLEAYEHLRTGEAVIAIGTHALIQQDVEFLRLGAIVTDEQHRFGVRQRAAFAQKGSNPDVLIMSATPIPRTLSLILYGDLDVSALRTLPPGRKPILTRFVPEQKRADLYRYLKKQAETGCQSYVVCPLVEDSEAVDAHDAQGLYEELTGGLLAGVAVELLHGRMSGAEKAAAVDRFRRGDAKVLVSTTVVEVGVNVPSATIMVIEDADRFGLAQLHQLRGRVGRGCDQSYCFLLSNVETKEAQERLNILCSSQDGFEIAQRDLELRGPGEFLGTRQSGVSDAKLARWVRDMDMLKQAQKMADEVLYDSAYDGERKILLDSAYARYSQKIDSLAFN